VAAISSRSRKAATSGPSRSSGGRGASPHAAARNRSALLARRIANRVHGDGCRQHRRHVVATTGEPRRLTSPSRRCVRGWT
jgi:hypothetical protein